mmetsp:Transcript_13100/g.19715  ORF Transcript_13100/g.19715 Transcript_13100/m.19715 type:complete len:91 (-) Transcript_13100:145-417(-)
MMDKEAIKSKKGGTSRRQGAARVNEECKRTHKRTESTRYMRWRTSWALAVPVSLGRLRESTRAVELRQKVEQCALHGKPQTSIGLCLPCK